MGPGAPATVSELKDPLLKGSAEASLHPRLVVQHSGGYADAFGHAVDLARTSPRAAGWLERYRADADDLVAERRPVAEGLPAESLSLPKAREVMRRVYSLAIMHHVQWHGTAAQDRTGDTRYRDRAWLELQAAAELDHWFPSHWLQTATMIHGFAIGYDWFHEEWDVAQRATIREALISKGLNPYFDALELPDHWVDQPLGWNVVCNGNAILGALAIEDVEPDLARRVLLAASEQLPHGLEIFHPGDRGGIPGSFRTGPMYWRSSTGFLAAVDASLRQQPSRSGITFPLVTQEGPTALGFRHTALFTLHVTGPTGASFPWGDGIPPTPQSSAHPWLSNLAQAAGEDQLAALAAWQGVRAAEENPLDWTQLPTSLLWFDPSIAEDPRQAGLPRDAYIPGPQPRRVAESVGSCELFTSRSAWLDRSALYLAARGGYNGNVHSDLDAGTFIVDALGYRWFTDFGSDDYLSDGYFDVGQFGRRWCGYRKRAEGHNVLVINPGRNEETLGFADMLFEGYGAVERYAFGDDGAWAIADLTTTHPDLRSWQRGWKVFDDRNQIIIQDDVDCVPGSEVWSFLHTEVEEIQVADDARSAVLHREDARLVVRLQGPAEARIQVMPAEALPTSPEQPAGAKDNSAFQKLAVHLTGITTARLVWQFSPLRPDQDVPPIADVIDLDQWHDPAEQRPADPDRKLP